MANCWERAESRTAKVGSQTKSLVRTFIITGTASEDEAVELLAAATSPYVGNLTRVRMDPTPVGGGVWTAEVEYAPADPASAAMPAGSPPPDVGASAQQPPGPNQPLGPEYTFDCTAQQTHVTQSLETVATGFAIPLAGAPDFARAINVDKERVSGVDVYSPHLEWTVQVTRAVVDLAYMTAVANLAAKTNNNFFYGFPRGSLLYLGATGQCGQELRWTVTHRFAYSPNKVNVSVGNGITVTPKRGWDYLWVAYKDSVTNNFGAQIPAAAYVERVYEEGNFALLEIGE